MSVHSIFGFHAIEAFLKVSPQKARELCLLDARKDTRIKSLLLLAENAGISISFLSRDELDRLAGSTQHQGAVLTCQKEMGYTENDLDLFLDKQNLFLLILDGIQDPHNLGACLRTANVAGVDAVISPSDRAVGITSTVRKVASGAVDNIPFISVTNLARTIKKIKEKGVWVYGLAADAERSIFEENLTGPIALVLGAEEKGLRRLTRELCDGLLSIPQHGTVGSLNVSVATGVCLFEAIRQRTTKIFL